MTTIELTGERWERARLREHPGRPGLPGLTVGALHFGPFAGWGAAGVVRAVGWCRPLGSVVRDEDIVRAAGEVACAREGIEPGQAFILVVPPPAARAWAPAPPARLIAAPVGELPL
jgi:hypothetical protein